MSKGASGRGKSRNPEAIETIQSSLPRNDSERAAKEEDARYEVYRDERKALVEGEQASADQFDKTILTLSGGALAISLVFLEKIAPKPKQETLLYLYLAWGALVCSLCAILSSFLTSQHAYRRQRKVLENALFAELGQQPDTTNCWASLTRILNWLSILVFVFGVGMLVCFSIQNLKAKPSDNEAKKLTITGATNEQRSSTNSK